MISAFVAGVVASLVAYEIGGSIDLIGSWLIRVITLPLRGERRAERRAELAPMLEPLGSERRLFALCELFGIAAGFVVVDVHAAVGRWWRAAEFRDEHERWRVAQTRRVKVAMAWSVGNTILGFLVSAVAGPNSVFSWVFCVGATLAWLYITVLRRQVRARLGR